MIDKSRLIPELEKHLGEGEKRSGWLFWSCPFHDDKSPSFGVNLAEPETFHCYGCGAHGDVGDFLQRHHRWTFPEVKAYLEGDPLPPEEKAKREAEKAEAAAKRAEEAAQRAEDAERRIRELTEKKVAEDYHYALRGLEHAQEAWEAHGIGDLHWQEVFMLGFAPQSESLTIPIRQPGLINIKHRKLIPTAGRYFFELGGISDMMNSLHFAFPEIGISDTIWITEGEKKALITFMHLDNYDQVISAPKVWNESIASVFEGSHINYVVDPDVDRETIWKNVKLLERGQVNIIRPLDKVDDMLIEGTLDANGLLRLADTGVRV